jgi:hypothetical protein
VGIPQCIYFENHETSEIFFKQNHAGINYKQTLVAPHLLLAITEKRKSYTIALENEGALVLQQLNNSAPGAILHVNHWAFAANSCNSTKQSTLMLALQKRIGLESVLKLIDSSTDTILVLDTENRNVFFYWAMAVCHDLEYIAVLPKLWAKFSAEFKISNAKSIFDYINAQEVTTGDTFLHYIIKNSASQILNILRPIFETGNSHELAMPLFKRNNEDKTPLDLIEESLELDTKLIVFILLQVGEIAFMFTNQHISDIDEVFPRNQSFFNSNVTKNIQRFLNSNDYMSVLALSFAHDSLRLPLKGYMQTSLAQIKDAPSSLETAKKYTQILEYFGNSEFLEIYDGKLLLAILNQAATRPENAALLEQLSNDFFRVAELQISITDTLPWLRLKQHLNKRDNVVLTPIEIANYKRHLAPRLNQFNRNTGYTALEFAVLEEDFELIKFFVEEMHAAISTNILNHAILYAFRTTPDNTAPSLDSNRARIANYLLMKTKLNKDSKDGLALTVTLYQFAFSEPISLTLLKWIIKNDFSFNLIISNNNSLLQIMLSILNQENYHKLYEIFEIMLSPDIELSDILRHKDKHGLTCIHYLFKQAIMKNITPEQLLNILKLFVNVNVDLIDIGLKENKTILHLAALLNYAPLIEFLHSAIPTANLEDIYHTAGDNSVISYINKLRKDNKISAELASLFMEKHNELNNCEGSALRLPFNCS